MVSALSPIMQVLAMLNAFRQLLCLKYASVISRSLWLCYRAALLLVSCTNKLILWNVCMLMVLLFCLFSHLLFFYMCVRKKAFNKRHHMVHLNLSIALLLALLAFVSGVETASNSKVSVLIYQTYMYVHSHVAQSMWFNK